MEDSKDLFAGSFPTCRTMEDDFPFLKNGTNRKRRKNENQIYTIDGRHAGTNSKNLPKGIYILNGKKMIIK